MSGGSICVTRSLPIDAALVGTVLSQLRRDTPGSSTAWTLGGRGSAQVDVNFFPVISSLNIPAANGAIPAANGAIPAANGAIPAANGAIPAANGAIPAANGAPAESPAWTTSARMWDPEAVAMVHAVVEVSAVATDECELTIRPDLPLAPWWAARVPALLELAQATIDELAEEMLWHASAKA